MSNIHVKLKDASSIYHDVEQGKTITGKNVVEVRKTSGIAVALKNGVLTLVEGKDVKKSAGKTKADSKTVTKSKDADSGKKDTSKDVSKNKTEGAEDKANAGK